MAKTAIAGNAGRSHLDAFVTQVDIDDLYGLYTYRLGNGAATDDDARRLFILYGDNGSGKTTVLQLVFNLLSRARSQGHRGYLARTPFRRLAVQLGTETRVTVSRSGERLTGKYHISMVRSGKSLLDGVVQTEDENKVAADQAVVLEYLALLDELNIDLFLLSDDRKGRSSGVDVTAEEEELLLYRMQQEELQRIGKRQHIGAMQLQSAQLLELAVGRLVSWIRSQALKGSSAGEVNTNTIYADIVRRIVRPRRGRPAANERDVDTLVEALRQLEERNRAFAEYGLTSNLSIDPVIEASTSAPASTRRIIASVLGPYVDGLRARLKALESLQQLVDDFVKSVNSFLYNKRVTLDIRTGLQIRSRTGELLTPRALSSGERQLLLLFCNTVLARDSASIFLIDEPEISLNVKWQRKLLDSLLRLTTDSPVQFMIATHSLELLARHKSAVRRLDEPAPALQ